MKIKIFSKLSLKLILILSGLLLVNLSIYTYLTITRLDEDLRMACAQNAYNISDIVKKSARYSMLLNRNEDLYQIIKTVGTEKGVDRIRIFNKFGDITYSSDSLEMGSSVDVNSEACNMCHSKPELPANLPWHQMIRYYKNAKGENVLGLINPIKNEPDCYTSDCHYHEPDKEILGVLDIVMTTEKTDKIVEANIKGIFTNVIIITILIAVSIGFLIALLVHKPMKEITKGINQLSEGNLDYKISVNSKDELGQMAGRFNDMAEKLDKAYNEIKEWSETLNIKVEEKNEELKKIYSQIVQIEKLASLGKLSATVAHELNNPLEGILTYSKLVHKIISKNNDKGDYDKVLKFLTLIADESSRCGKIVKDLLLFSHKDVGEFKLCDLVEIIEKSLSLINHHIEINKIKLVKDFTSESFNLVCDPQKIEQAFISVLINAIESMSEGGTLTLNVTRDDRNITIRIKDQGKGIAEKELPNIFEPFYTTKENHKGTGLGLSVTYGIIQQHKGEISVEETSIKGTTFKIILPIKI